MTPLFLPSLVGHCVATRPLPPLGTRAYDYVFAGNGIFLRAGNAHFTAQLCLHTWATETVRGLPSLQPYLTLHHSRLPRTLLRDMVADARTRRDSADHLQEALYRVVLQEHDSSSEFALDIPAQQTSAVSVTAAAPIGPVVLELHSHGAMSAFWSATDDRDEGGLGFFGVLGHLDRDIPQIRLRVGVYGYWWDMPISTLFDMETSGGQAMTETELAPMERVQIQDLYVATPLPLARYSGMAGEGA